VKSATWTEASGPLTQGRDAAEGQHLRSALDKILQALDKKPTTE
jgi:hypothetical protein